MGPSAIPTVLPFAVLFGVFVLFLAVIYGRSRYNRAHPAELESLQKRARGRLIGSISFTIFVAASACFTFWQDHFTPSWRFVLWTAFLGFLLGDLYGRWVAERQTRGGRPTPEP